MHLLRTRRILERAHSCALTYYIQQAGLFSFSGAKTGKRKKFTERRLLGYGMEQMFDVVQDVERYQEFLPWCHSSIVNTRRKDLLVGDLVVGIPPIVESYTSTVKLNRPHLIVAESTQGKLFSELINVWKFSPGLKGVPQSCIIEFHVSFEFKSALASQVSHVFFNEVVQAMTGAFYNEAKRRYGKESCPSRKIEIIASNDKS